MTTRQSEIVTASICTAALLVLATWVLSPRAEGDSWRFVRQTKVGGQPIRFGDCSDQVFELLPVDLKYSTETRRVHTTDNLVVTHSYGVEGRKIRLTFKWGYVQRCYIVTAIEELSDSSTAAK